MKFLKNIRSLVAARIVVCRDWLGLRKKPAFCVGQRVSATWWSQFGPAKFTGEIVRLDRYEAMIRPDPQWTQLPIDIGVWVADIRALPNVQAQRAEPLSPEKP